MLAHESDSELCTYFEPCEFWPDVLEIEAQLNGLGHVKAPENSPLGWEAQPELDDGYLA